MKVFRGFTIEHLPINKRQKTKQVRGSGPASLKPGLTTKWTFLPDAPKFKNHFQAVNLNWKVWKNISHKRDKIVNPTS